MPALDGVRALAVIAVVCFHADLSAASGGFLGVSVFFTLSGFLITSLLLAEHAATGAISLRRFAGRRARRLLPAAWLCICLVLLATPWWSAGQRAQLTGDALGALANIANWRAATAEVSYRDLLGQEPSPLAHFWSLAIEEQFYVLLPLVAVATLRFGRRVFAGTVALLLTLSAAATLALDDFDMVYNATHTRAAELLVGVALALAMQRRSGNPFRERALRWAGPIGFSALGILVVTARITDRWIASGGLIAVALLSALLIAGAHAPGPLASLLSSRVLGAIGRWSYGIYLFHWPVFVALTPERTSLSGLTLTFVRLGVVAAIAAASYVLVEQPIRRRTVLPTAARSSASACCAVAVLALVAVIVPPVSTSATEDLLTVGAAPTVRFDDQPPTPTTQLANDDGASQPLLASPAPVRPRPLSVLVVGSDTSALAELRGVEHVGEHTVTVVDATQPGCPIASGREVRFDDGTVVDVSRCERSAPFVRGVLDAQAARPDLIVVAAGPIDGGLLRRAQDRDFPQPSDLTSIAERFRAAELQVLALTQLLAEQDAPVLLSWAGGPGLFHDVLSRIDIEREAVIGLTSPDHIAAFASSRLTEAVADTPSATASDDAAARVLVIGDSTSLIMARALHDADHRLDVLWAGENGCPLVRATSLLPRIAAAPTPLACADFETKLEPIVLDFEPDVVLLVLGPTELAALTFGDDPTPRVPGDDTWVSVHDAEFEALLDVLGAGEIDPRVVVTNTPPIQAGQFSSREMAQPERLAAWNAQVDRWINDHPDVRMLDIATPIVAYETTNGSMRPDGAHAEVTALTAIASEWFVEPLLDAAVSRRGSR